MLFNSSNRVLRIHNAVMTDDLDTLLTLFEDPPGSIPEFYVGIVIEMLITRDQFPMSHNVVNYFIQSAMTLERMPGQALSLLKWSTDKDCDTIRTAFHAFSLPNLDSVLNLIGEILMLFHDVLKKLCCCGIVGVRVPELQDIDVGSSRDSSLPFLFM